MGDEIVATSHGRIAIRQTHGAGLPVLFIHGNSTCKDVFVNQLSAFGDTYRIVAVDLPGHGRSENALHPERTYTIPGYADVMVELAERLDLGRFAIFGWSLGGHIAIEMMSRGVKLSGVAVSGAPAVGKGLLPMLKGFRVTRLTPLIGKEVLSKKQCQTFASVLINDKPPGYLVDAVCRTDGIARSLMMKGIKSKTGGNQKKAVESSKTPLAIINGANDPLIRHNYIARKVSYKNLWGNKVNIIAGAGHAPFLQNQKQFNHIIGMFFSSLITDHQIRLP